MARSSVKERRRKVLLGLLRQVRLDAGLRQTDVAKKLGKPQSFVSNYESGERRLDLLELQAVCEVVGIKVGDFVGRFFRLSWKWRGRSTVKITERTLEETKEALHRRRESRHLRRHFWTRSRFRRCVTTGATATVLYRWQKEFFENGPAAFHHKSDPTTRPSRNASSIWRKRFRPRMRFWRS